MKRTLVGLVTAAALAVSFAAPASASQDGTGCKLAEKLGVVWIRECGNP